MKNQTFQEYLKQSHEEQPKESPIDTIGIIAFYAIWPMYGLGIFLLEVLKINIFLPEIIITLTLVSVGWNTIYQLVSSKFRKQINANMTEIISNDKIFEKEKENNEYELMEKQVVVSAIGLLLGMFVHVTWSLIGLVLCITLFFQIQAITLGIALILAVFLFGFNLTIILFIGYGPPFIIHLLKHTYAKVKGEKS